MLQRKRARFDAPYGSPLETCAKAVLWLIASFLHRVDIRGVSKSLLRMLEGAPLYFPMQTLMYPREFNAKTVGRSAKQASLAAAWHEPHFGKASVASLESVTARGTNLSWLADCSKLKRLNLYASSNFPKTVLPRLSCPLQVLTFGVGCKSLVLPEGLGHSLQNLVVTGAEIPHLKGTEECVRLKTVSCIFDEPCEGKHIFSLDALPEKCELYALNLRGNAMVVKSMLPRRSFETIRKLTLSGVEASAELTKSLKAIGDQLTHLDLSFSSFSDTGILGERQNLTHLDLSGARFQGGVELSKFPMLSFLGLRCCCKSLIKGILEQDYRGLKKVWLDLFSHSHVLPEDERKNQVFLPSNNTRELMTMT